MKPTPAPVVPFPKPTPAPPSAITFDVPHRALCTAREKGGQRRWFVIELILDESTHPDTVVNVKSYKVIDSTFHRLAAEEKAQLEIVRRKDRDAIPKHQCSWSVGVTPEHICGLSAIYQTDKYKLCEDHAKHIRTVYKISTAPLPHSEAR